MVFGALLTVGCDEECVVGECFSFEQCEEECIEVCEGEVLDAFCDVGGLCECDCAIQCLL